MKRRDFLKSGAALAALSGCAGGIRGHGHVVVVGGGYGGATAAKYLRLWSGGKLQVSLVERELRPVSCPLSNLVIGGVRTLADITLDDRALKTAWGVRLIRDEALGIDAERRTLRLAKSGALAYDRLLLSPGVDFLWERLPGLSDGAAREKIPHAWKAGPQTLLLRKQLESMRDGGVFAIAIPMAPYRCPPGPYERACLVAAYLKRHKPRSKLVILDANEEITSKKTLFSNVWKNFYPGIIEYRPNSEVRDVDAAHLTAILDFEHFRADVLNLIPPQRAGAIAAETGLKLINKRWVDIDWQTLESSIPGIHVLGDAVFSAPAMPKSGHMANQHAKMAAAALLNLFAGEAPPPSPLVNNVCYSFVDETSAIHVASVHRYDPATRLMQPVKGAGGFSVSPSESEGQTALAWAKNIWADMGLLIRLDRGDARDPGLGA